MTEPRTPPLGPHHAYLLPVVHEVLDEVARAGGEQRAFDLGCGNGSVAHHLAERGWRVVGVDPGDEDMHRARGLRPEVELHDGSAYDDLAARFGTFPVVISLEVVEHLVRPRAWAATLFDLVEPGGRAVISAPYHGYVKNLAISLAGGWDRHMDPFWEGGHLRLWSVRTMRRLLADAGFDAVEVRRVGRVPPLAKSLVAIARRPG